jgi:altronate dehydratase
VGSFEKALTRAVREGQGLIEKLDSAERDAASPSELRIALKCGGSSSMSGVSSNPALGAISKTGTYPIVYVLEYGERIRKIGVSFLFTPDDTPELFMGMAAAGVQILVFAAG